MYPCKDIASAGGVSANSHLRKKFTNLGAKKGLNVHIPKMSFCTDNAAMIAWAGIQRFKKNLLNKIDVEAKSRWPLDENAPYMKGPGLKL